MPLSEQWQGPVSKHLSLNMYASLSSTVSVSVSPVLPVSLPLCSPTPLFPARSHNIHEVHGRECLQTWSNTIVGTIRSSPRFGVSLRETLAVRSYLLIYQRRRILKP